MRVRAQDSAGDYTFGQGEANFLINSPEAVGQLVQTNLLLIEGEWFLDSTVGTPWFTDVIGYNTSSLRDTAIRAVILGTPGVTSIVSYQSSFNAATRKFSVITTIQTQYSATPITVGPVAIQQ